MVHFVDVISEKNLDGIISVSRTKTYKGEGGLLVCLMPWNYSRIVGIVDECRKNRKRNEN